MSEILFRIIVRFYPRRVRYCFGGEMLDYMQADLQRRRDTGGTPGYWRWLLSDAARGLFATWSNRPPSRSRRPGRGLLRELVQILRDLVRRPLFTSTVVLTLAIGVGASASVFSLVHGVVLSPLPYAAPEQLVWIHQQNSPTNRFVISMADLLGLEESQRAFESITAYTSSEAVLSGEDRPVKVRISAVTASFFDTFGLRPASGRGFAAGEDRPGAEPVVVLSHDLGERHFGAGVDAVGEVLVLDGQSHTVVGVMAPGVQEVAGRRADLWRALHVSEPDRRGPFFLFAVGRLAEGQTLEGANSDLADVSTRIFPRWADSFRDENARLTALPLGDVLVGDTSERLMLVFGAVLVLLLIAISNVVNLTLARTTERSGDLAIRTALGASRPRIAQLLFIESFVVALIGGVLGIALAMLSVAAFKAADPGLPRLADVSVGAPVVGYALGVVLVSSLAMTMSSMLIIPTQAVGSTLKESSRGAAGSRRANALRTMLVASEFALSLPLLVAAGLLATSLLRPQNVDPGFDPDGVIAVPVSLPGTDYPDTSARAEFWQASLAAIRSLPGVAAAGVAVGLPPDSPTFNNNFDLVDRPVEAGTSEPVTPWAAVDEGFRDALGIRLLEGRWFDELQDSTGALPLVVTRSWADRFYSGEEVLGRQVYEGGNREQAAEVVGVVADVKYDGLAGNGETVYFPTYQFWRQSMNLVVKSAASTESTIAAVRQAI